LSAASSWRLKAKLSLIACVAVTGLAGFAGSASAAEATAYVANYGSSTLTPIPTATNLPGSPFSAGDGPAAIAITPDGKTAYVADALGGAVKAINLLAHAVTHTITVRSRPTAVAITPDGKTAYVAESGAGSVQTIDVASNTVTHTISVGSNPTAIAITPNGKTVYVACDGSFDVVAISTATKKVTATIPVDFGYGIPVGIAITPDGKKAYVPFNLNLASDTGGVQVFDLPANTPTISFPPSFFGYPTSVAISPDGKTAYVAANTGLSNYVYAIDVATDTVTGKVAVRGAVSAIAITPDGKTAYVTILGASASSPGAVVPITLATSRAGTPIIVGVDPDAIAISAERGLPPPANISPPSISPNTRPTQGETLTESHGSWRNAPTSYSYRWEDCDTAGNNCSAIRGATSRTHTLVASDLGHTIRVLETASNAGGKSAPVSSPATAVVHVTRRTSGRAKVGPVAVGGVSMSVPVSCGGPLGATCRVTATLSITEIVQRGKVVAIVAHMQKAGKNVLLGAAAVTMSARQTMTLPITLNGAGRRLLASHHTLKVRLTVRQAVDAKTNIVESKTITFKRHV